MYDLAGVSEAVLVNITEKEKQRFFKKIKRTVGCWPWTATRDSCGYGQIGIRGRTMNAHRLSWLIHKGDIPKGIGSHGMCVLHTCDTPSCVNPEHLFLGSQADNMADCRAKGRSNAVLTEEDVRRIREARLFGAVQQDLADVWGVSQGHICGLVLRKRRAHIR